jgi:hypothetical protein
VPADRDAAALAACADLAAGAGALPCAPTGGAAWPFLMTTLAVNGAALDTGLLLLLHT